MLLCIGISDASVQACNMTVDVGYLKGDNKILKNLVQPYTYRIYLQIMLTGENLLFICTQYQYADIVILFVILFALFK